MLAKTLELKLQLTSSFADLERKNWLYENIWFPPLIKEAYAAKT